MRAKSVFLSCVVFCLFALSLPAEADIIGPTKWSQLPDMGPYGYDFSSETTVPSMVADDYLCISPLPVIDVHWWGSYYVPGPLYPYPTSDNLPDPTIPAAGGDPQPPGILQGFNIEFYTDIPAGVDPFMPWSHPGTLLYEEFVDISQVAEVFFGTITHIGGIEENVWQYNVDLPVPFEQDRYQDPQDIDGDGIDDGTVFWLKIQAVHTDPEIQWGWHEAESLWHDNAVQQGYFEPEPLLWDLLPNKDMAFELTVIPEPSFLIGGLLALGLLLRLRRR